MIINTTILLILSIIIGCAAVFLYLKKTGDTLGEVWRVAFLILFAAGAMFYLAIESIATKVVVLEGDSEWNYKHETILMLGSAYLMLSNGEVIDTNGHELKLGKTYCYNFTDTGMLLYPTVYTPTEGIFLFDTPEDQEVPDAFYIDYGCYDEILTIPEFWFRDAPETLEVSEYFLERLWNSIFNISDIRWSVIPYAIEEE